VLADAGSGGRKADAAGTDIDAGAVVLLAAKRGEERTLLEPMEAKTPGGPTPAMLLGAAVSRRPTQLTTKIKNPNVYTHEDKRCNTFFTQCKKN
jgi:hypothetical protein